MHDSLLATKQADKAEVKVETKMLHYIRHKCRKKYDLFYLNFTSSLPIPETIDFFTSDTDLA
jgi:hypothetical protein